jgi:hypothetical protein
MNDAISVLRELVSLKRLHDKIEAAEASGTENFVDGQPLPFAKDDYTKRKAVAWAAAATIVGAELPEGRNSQHVLKAEGECPDATDRETCANASPVGGPMGAGQAAAAAPAGALVFSQLDERFLAARLRRLFAHFKVAVPDGGDDARLIGNAAARSITSRPTPTCC